MASPFTERRSPSRRFLPPDPRVAEPYRLTPQLALRVGVLAALALAVFAVLFLRLWALQVLSGDRYVRAAQNNQLRTIPIEAPRGAIFDREGRLLVTNVPGTAVKLWPADMPEEGRYRMVQKLSAILRVPVRDITAAIEERKDDPLTPVTLKTAVREEQVATLLERREEFRGVEIAQTYLRSYERQAMAAQILGYAREISKEELAAKRGEGYRAGDVIGKAGIEAAFDRFLRGTPGMAQRRIDSRGNLWGSLQVRRFPSAGNGIRLTLDARLQRAAEQALRLGIARARANDNLLANGGALVALDPRDGAVLALASNPTYKPSVYVGRIQPERLAALADEEANVPLLNRVLSGQYPPGSTFKPVTALAAIQEGLLSPFEQIQCTPVNYYGLDRQPFRNWNPNVNEPMVLQTALAESCDTYFYDVGNRFYERGSQGRTQLQKWAAIFGFGHSAGIDIGGESEGLLPTPAWRKRIGRRPWDKAWNPGDSIQLAIGQKDLLVTPLQMARFYALLANGGKLVSPYVVQSVERLGDENSPPNVLRRFAPKPPKETRVDRQALAVVNAGLRAAAGSPGGTSYGVFGSFPVPISGKTGTAEKSVDGQMRDQSWWCGFGPAARGRGPIALCAVIENGGFGAEAAAPAALRVLEEWYGVQAPVQTVVASD